MNYYSVPHTPQEIKSPTNNVVFGFAKEQQCFDVIKEIKDSYPNDVFCAVYMPFDELKYVSSLLRMPIAVVIETSEKESGTHYEIRFCATAR